MKKRKSFIVLCCSIVFMILVSALPHKQETPLNEDVHTAVKRAVVFLQDLQRNDGAICDTINPLFDTWETILAATAIFQVNKDTNEKTFKQALSFLRKNENDKGLICHNQKCRQAYCLETTAVYFDLLLQTGDREKVRAGLKYVAALQKQTGEWEIGNPDVTIQTNFPSVTGFVLNTCQHAGTEVNNKQSALQWLLAKQTAAGDWGFGWEYYGCPAYALWPIMKTLRQNRSAQTEQAEKKALVYIISTQEKDGSWFYQDRSVQKQVSAELQTALMLAALQGSVNRDHPAVLRGINFLVRSQQSKRNWNGGYFPIPQQRYTKSEYIFATAITVAVLNQYLRDQ